MNSGETSTKFTVTTAEKEIIDTLIEAKKNAGETTQAQATTLDSLKALFTDGTN